jgi:Zn-dependent protease
MGILHIGVANGGYINVCEYVHTRWKNTLASLMLVFDMLTVIITGIYWKWISKNASGLLIFGIGCNAVSFIAILFVPKVQNTYTVSTDLENAGRSSLK